MQHCKARGATQQLQVLIWHIAYCYGGINADAKGQDGRQVTRQRDEGGSLGSVGEAMATVTKIGFKGVNSWQRNRVGSG